MALLSTFSAPSELSSATRRPAKDGNRKEPTTGRPLSPAAPWNKGDRDPPGL